MTLVPIIYTSLLIFSAILLFVILVSYISFRTKSSFKKVNELRVPTGNQNLQMRPAAIPIPHAPIIIRKESPVVVRRSSPQAEYARSHSEKGINASDYRHFSARNATQRPTSLTRENRIVIMNDSNKLQTGKPVPSQTKERTYQKLPDMNLLNYYSDRTDSEFITLTA